MKTSVRLTDAAVSDILEQSDWYEQQAAESLAERWETAVTSTLLRIARNPRSGSPSTFKAIELQGVRRMAVDGFTKHLVFTGLRSEKS